MNDIKFPCPCCGYLGFNEPPGSYDICSICGWEDDLSQLRFPNTSGANRETLVQAQEEYARSRIQPPNRTEAHDPEWRIIDTNRDNIEETESGQDYGQTYPEDYARLYYWRASYWRG